MEFVKCYQDLCREIEIYEMRLESLIAQKDAIMDGWLKPISDISGIDYSKPRVQENHCKLDMMEQLPHIEALEKDIDKYKILLWKIKEARRVIEKQIQNLSGLDQRIIRMKSIEELSLKQISLELGYSYTYIRQRYSKIKNRSNLVEKTK